MRLAVPCRVLSFSIILIIIVIENISCNLLNKNKVIVSIIEKLIFRTRGGRGLCFFSAPYCFPTVAKLQIVKASQLDQLH